ncbi:MAG: fibronectin type III domain-containing protein, partial [Candidatus Hodarchaeota archaeon]
EVGATGNTISWTPTDDDPSSYNITQDGSLVRDRAWNTSGETITIGVDGLSAGTYVYRCTVYDSAGQSAFDKVSVTVVSSVPTINFPSDISYEEGATGQSITWTPLDDDPASYNITRDCSLLRDRAWNMSGETITIGVDGLIEGTYVYRCTVYDSAGQNAFDEVTVTVLASGRVPSPPLNLTATSSSNLVTLTWNLPSDSGSSEIVEYRVYRSTYAGHYNFRGSTTSLEFIDNTVSNGMTYYYVVTAVNAHGESDYSEEISVIPLALTSESTETTSSTIESPQVTNGFLFSMIILPITILIFFRKRRNQR